MVPGLTSDIVHVPFDRQSVHYVVCTNVVQNLCGKQECRVRWELQPGNKDG